ncbi:FAD-dependent oxidoreductase [Acidithiobacillus sp. IBUN Pt1247-S3]|uniref:FAD-dependent oxidoreductase n=1 Tax=Acidithiobacillus sp. IBUN Pt1247-S3 TaxID=3166642 RepID=UPI0034E3FD8C
MTENAIKHLLIIGGSDAGISAALRARELAPAWQVTIATADRYPNFSICGIPYFLSGEVGDAANLAHRKAADIKALGIELLLDHTVESIDPVAHCATTRDKSGRVAQHGYDKLVIATGAASVRPPLSGLDLPGVFLLRWMDDAFAFQKHLEKVSPRTIAIAGGGYIGLEMAEALTRRGIQVTVIEMAPSVMTTVDPDLGQLVGAELQRNGVRVATGQAISSIGIDGDVLQIEGPNNFRCTADMVLVAVGARPETEIALAAGIELGFKGALKVNRRMETNVPDIYAAGDCVETWHRITQSNAYLPLGTTAHKQGRIAGENAVGGDRIFEGSLGTQSVRVFDYVIARTGFHARDAANAGFAPLSVDYVAWDHKVYYPGAKEMTIRVTADQFTQRLLGAQIIGRYGTEVSKRIDIFAAAIYHGMNVEAFNDLDLSYTPPLSSPWDPVQMAAQAWSASARNSVRS